MSSDILTSSYATLNVLESAFLNKFNHGFRTYEDLKETLSYDEVSMRTVIESLTARNIIEFNTKTKEYEYQTKVEGDIVLLDGNIMLPTTIIRRNGKLLVTRGEWYEFAENFDVRRIVWNVQLPTRNKSTLAELVRESVMKVRKTKNVHLAEYDKLKKVIIPYSKDVLFIVDTVGADVTDITLFFRLFLDEKNTGDSVMFDDFRIKATIETADLIKQVTCLPEHRKFETIKIPRILSFSDFIFNDNCIPYNRTENTIDYLKITGTKSKMVLQYFTINESGVVKRNDVETYLDAIDGIDRIKQLFEYASNHLLDLDFMIEN